MTRLFRRSFSILAASAPALADEGTQYFYHWAGNSTYNDYDWNIAILGGRSADRFDFGFAGQNHGW